MDTALSGAADAEAPVGQPDTTPGLGDQEECESFVAAAVVVAADASARHRRLVASPGQPGLLHPGNGC